MMRKLWNYIVVAVGLLGAWFAYRSIKKTKQRQHEYEQVAETIEASGEAQQADLDRAAQAREKAEQEWRDATSKKRRATERLQELETKRGSRTAAELARSINNLL